MELICSNAVSFNQKISKVYKNAQALSKASRKQFQIERSLLLEAIAVLHPGGVEAARKDQAEEEKNLKLAPPPKKPAKPSKPPKKPPTLTGLPSASLLMPKPLACSVPYECLSVFMNDLCTRNEVAVGCVPLS